MNRKALLITLGAVVAAALMGWLAGMRVKSPAEAAAETAPPKASPILVAAELRELSTDVVTRGTGRYGSGQQLTLAPSTLKSGPGTATSVPSVGRMLKEGDVAMTVSGRPVFLFAGNTPAYRDLGPGMSGRDVRQLETTLKRLGLAPGSVDGLFDRATEAAVSRLYARSGFAAFRATEGQLASTRPVQSNFVPGSRARGGIQVPADEIIFVASLPVRVSEVQAPLGGTLEGPIMTVSNTKVLIDSSVPVAQARLLAPGKEVFIDEPDLNIKGKGVISSVAGSPGTNGVDGYHVYFQVRVVDAPPTIVKASVRLRVPITSSGKKVLVVPVTAVTLGPDGASRVQKKQGNGFDFVTVTPRLSSGGFVEIEVVKGTLKPGDMVVVGFERSGAKSSG
jgi:peptidoglycan hydrolase-like protein with peptidoglycan-binding domain